MSLHAYPPPTPALDFARQVLRAEAAALNDVADRLGDSFVRAVDLIAACRGRVAVTGVGKSADVAAKIVGTLNSTGTRAYLLDATRAMHGDLGMVHPDDVALVLSHSGESEEIVRLLDPLGELAAGIIAVTGNGQSDLARMSTLAVVYGAVAETCPLSLAPSTSTTVMLALGDALAFVLSDRRAFSAEEFARYHPAGSLGRKLARVETLMRTGPEVRLASADETVRDIFARSRLAGRRTGAVMLAEADGRLCGLFTDSDLARLFERRRDAAIDRPIREVMTPDPITVSVGTRVADALEILQRYKISELPVVDADGRPVGLLDITDVIGLAAAAAKPLAA
jgi:arabinose-5-phosphate isomerase